MIDSWASTNNQYELFGIAEQVNKSARFVQIVAYLHKNSWHGYLFRVRLIYYFLNKKKWKKQSTNSENSS